MSANPFRPGERIALPALPIIKIENNVAVLEKMRLVVEDGCGARHIARVASPFLIRGGFRVEAKKLYKIKSNSICVKYTTKYGGFGEECLPPRSIYVDTQPNISELAERLVRENLGDKVETFTITSAGKVEEVVAYYRRFKHIELIWGEDEFPYVKRRRWLLDGVSPDAGSYYIYEFVTPDEAKLVDDISRIDYVLHMFTHRLSSRSAGAKIKVLGGDVVWQDIRSTYCAIDSVAIAMVVARYKSKLAIAKNDAPYRGPEEWIVEEWESTFPPRRISQHRTTDPVPTSLTPEDVV